jgi:hypothetical protein
MRSRRGATALAAAVAGIAAGLFLLLFLIVNDAWVPVRVPGLPWSTDPSLAAFEARLFAVVLVSFLCGVAATGLFWRLLSADQRRRAREDLERIRGLESELDSLSKLVVTSRDKG